MSPAGTQPPVRTDDARSAGAGVGRLFWKFFLMIGLVQVVTTLAVGMWIGADQHHRAAHPPPPFDLPPPGGSFLHIPTEVIIGACLAALVSSALLAWFLYKPIRNLRSGLAAAAAGDLQVRVTDRMGAGNDELKDLGREFDRMAERLQALIAAQRHLLHDVSHEMRSPLARIRAAIGLASQQPDQTAAAVERIDRESVRMDRLIGELLALSRLQSQEAADQQEDIDLGELLSVIVDDASFEAAACGRSVHLHAGAGASVRGNAELLRRAIENVVRNGIKFSHEGGSVHVAIEPPAERDAVVVVVRDAGPGIPESDLAAVFEPFFRSGNGHSREGHGLGLAIAHRIIRNHGGTIAASNLAGGGLQVAISLPALSGAR